MESWKDISGFVGLYKVSDVGNVMALERVWVTGRNTCRYKEQHVMKLIFRKGYLYVPLTKDGIQKQHLVHRLVAKAFVSNPESKPQVNHLDGNKMNNRSDNLEWCTSLEKQLHAFRIGLKVGKDCTSREVIQFDLSGSIIKEWKSLKEITDTLGFDRSAIIKVCKNENKTSYGFKWKYKKEKAAKLTKALG